MLVLLIFFFICGRRGGGNEYCNHSNANSWLGPHLVGACYVLGKIAYEEFQTNHYDLENRK